MAPKLCQLVDRWASITASVSLSDTDSYSYGDEESGEGRGPAPPRTSADGQPLAAGTRTRKRKQAKQKGGGNWRNASRRGDRMAKIKKDTVNETIRSAQVPITRTQPVCTSLPCKKKGSRTGAKGNRREQEQRADRKEKEVQEAAKTDEGKCGGA